MTARDELFSVASQDMPVSSDEVNLAINAFVRELAGIPNYGETYLRKRFAEAIWESGLEKLLHTLDEDKADSVVHHLVERLLIEAGID